MVDGAVLYHEEDYEVEIFDKDGELLPVPLLMVDKETKIIAFK